MDSVEFVSVEVFGHASLEVFGHAADGLFALVVSGYGGFAVALLQTVGTEL